MAAWNERAGFVRFQQERARHALAQGELRAARAALRVLRATDFAGVPVTAEALLAVIRDSASTDEEVIAAAAALVRLPPADAPPTPTDA
ncbi:MAG TPA: hypothetical protein VKZ63_07495 [Kofleriaceae bacterium]|nr:hypothetical protein [Kofleriaceae bacterium]